MRTAVGILLPLLIAPTLLTAQARPTLTPADYGQWESLRSATLAPDGTWLAYEIRRVNDEHEIRARSLERDTEHILQLGEAPTFSGTSRWLAYRIIPSPSERKRLEREKKPVRNDLGLIELETGVTITVDDIESFVFSEDGSYLAYLGYAEGSEEARAADLRIRDLAAGTVWSFGNVSEFAWSEARAVVAMTIARGEQDGNGVHLFDPTTGSLRVLDHSADSYRGLSWREEDDDLVVFRSREDDVYRNPNHVILAWRDLTTDGGGDKLMFDPDSVAGFPEGMRVAEHRELEWSHDGSAVYFGIQERRVKPDSATAESRAADKVSNVQIWHAKDYRIIPMQRVQEREDLERTLLSVWHVDRGAFVALGSDYLEDVEILNQGPFVVERSGAAYRVDAQFGRPRYDVYLIDTRTGERSQVIQGIRYFLGGSASGRYLSYFRGDAFWTYDVTTGQHANLTDSIDGLLANEESDYPVEQQPPHGVAGWTTDDRQLLVYDKYDVWLVGPGVTPTRLTDGRRDSVTYRYVRLDRDGDDVIDLETPLYLSMAGERTKQTGYARLRLGRDVERLFMMDKTVNGLQKADDADVFIYAVQAFDDSPDLLTAGPALRGGRAVTRTNPFQGDFAWGRGELVDFVSSTGRPLQAALLYPANYDASRRYPMIVYTYEIVSRMLHRYEVPSEEDYYNFTVYTQQGYFVLLPDIVYRPRDPGRSALEAVEPAVQAVLDRGLVDPERVGLLGHSWGGYQATYLPTQTDIFAAAVAGAPLTNFLSMMGAIHWRQGLPETSHWETGQARMDVPYWEDLDAHLRNSPAAFVQQLETPMLMMFGDEDGTVDWHQGVEFYNFARRAGKRDFVLLVYPGEDHGLRQEENQVDYHRRILQWFGHYLKGDPAPKWITEGMSYLERQCEIERGTVATDHAGCG